MGHKDKLLRQGQAPKRDERTDAATASPAPASAHCGCNGRDALREAAAAPQVVSNRKHEEGRHIERG